MAVDTSFYKNVFLLMQMVPASYECMKHFKKGMFDKPNTSGFIYISYYLLSIYNAKHFQKMVTWPLLNKTDEKKYRMEVKEYLEIVANENPDISFPSILMSHLLQAGGTRFLIIMWKMSQISLRTYITKECQMKILQAPSIGNNKDIVQLHFDTINLKRDIVISNFCERAMLISEHFKHYIKCTSNDLKKIQTKIFELKENLMKFVPILPVDPTVVTRLIDTEDTEIINLWKRSIDEKIELLHKVNFNLNKLKVLSDRILVLISSTNCKVFDCNDLPKVSNEIVPLFFSNSREDLNYGLYMNESLVFHTLLSILSQVLERIDYYLKTTYLSDLSVCEPEIIEHCETIKLQRTQFQQLIIQISDMLCNVQCGLQEKSLNCTFETDLLFPVSSEIILISPNFNFHANEYVDEEKLFRKLWFSPMQGKYKHLFKRYIRKSPLNTSFKDSAIKLQFDDSTDNVITNWKSPQKLSLSNRMCSPNRIKISPRYSRLFSTSDTKKFKDTNAASTPKPSRINKTPRRSIINNTNTKININAAMKNIFDLSCKLTKVVSSLSKS